MRGAFLHPLDAVAIVDSSADRHQPVAEAADVDIAAWVSRLLHQQLPQLRVGPVRFAE
jgi:hypothetical protein